MATRCLKDVEIRKPYYMGEFRCVREFGHAGECSPFVDCCGDRYACYVTADHCKYCGQNDGWCASCLRNHQVKCCEQRLDKYEKDLRQLVYTIETSELPGMEQFRKCLSYKNAKELTDAR